MSRRRRWLQRYLDLFVMEVRCADGARYIVSIDTTGFGECWLPVETAGPEAREVALLD